jgi:hypothetical protein
MAETQKHIPITQIISRVISYTDIQFANKEILLLNKEMKCNLHCKHKNWQETLALEA